MPLRDQRTFNSRHTQAYEHMRGGLLTDLNRASPRLAGRFHTVLHEQDTARTSKSTLDGVREFTAFVRTELTPEERREFREFLQTKINVLRSSLRRGAIDETKFDEKVEPLSTILSWLPDAEHSSQRTESQRLVDMFKNAWNILRQPDK